MTPDQQQNFYVQLLGALLISTVSGAISVGRRILRYGQVTFVAAATEMSAALLAGYLAWDAYPVVANQLPTGITQPIFTSASAYLGIKIFQYVERLFDGKTSYTGSPK